MDPTKIFKLSQSQSNMGSNRGEPVSLIVFSEGRLWDDFVSAIIWVVLLLGASVVKRLAIRVLDDTLCRQVNKLEDVCM